MVKPLTPKQKSAVGRAVRNPDLQPILFSKAAGLEWYTPFVEAGFLDPAAVPRPIPADHEGFFTVPAWPIANYLVSTSAEFSRLENVDYAKAVLEFIRASTEFAKRNGFSNCRVWWQLSKVIQNLPTELVTRNDLQIVDYWLDDPYERGLVAEEVGENWLGKLLDATDPHSRELSLDLIELLYRVSISETKLGESSRKVASMRFGGWYARKLTDRIAAKAGRVLGISAVDGFRNRLENTVGTLGNDRWSCIWRPAVEEHGQNLRGDDAEVTLLVAFRDALLAFVERDDDEVVNYMRSVLQAKADVTKRVAIHVVNRRFERLEALTPLAIDPALFRDNLRHELWHFLHDRYGRFTPEERQTVERAIFSIRKQEDGQENLAATAYRRTLWLSAIKDHSAAHAEQYRAAVAMGGGEPEHPDFASYMTTRWGGTESPIPQDELLTLELPQLVARLQEFNRPGSFAESGMEGLAKALRQVVKSWPLRFTPHLQEFVGLELPYVHAVVEAYSDLWTEKAQLPWEEIWKALLDFCMQVVVRDAFWTSPDKYPGHFVANRRWIVSSVARLIEKGTESDEHAFPEDFLDTAERILHVMLNRQEAEEFSEDSDAVSIAINSPRGACLEAMIDLALRSCRIADHRETTHTRTWQRFSSLFDSELARAHRGEMEFATLVVNYLPNFLYLGREWVMENLPAIFPNKERLQWHCAMQAYAFVNTVYEPIYKFLKDGGHFIRALDDAHIKDRVREKIVQNVAVAYMSDFESIEADDSLMNWLITRGEKDELDQLVWFLWTFRDQQDPKVRAKILALWPRVLAQLDTSTPDGKAVAAHLCDWIVFVDAIDDSNRELIYRCIKFVSEAHNSYDLLKNIARFTERQPDEAFQMWKLALGASTFSYPTEAIETALSRMVRRGPDGVRNAKEIVSLYLTAGNEQPWKILEKMTGGDQSISCIAPISLDTR